MTVPTTQQRIAYHRSAARWMRIEAATATLHAEAARAECDVIKHNHFLNAGERSSASCGAHGRAESAERNAAGYRRLADDHDRQREAAESEEIKRDYYSGPPGSYTGD